MMIFMGIMNLLLGKPRHTINLSKNYCKFNDNKREDLAIE